MSLKDLNHLALEAQKAYSLYKNQEVILSSDFKNKFSELLPRETIHYHKFTSDIKTSSGLNISFPNQWFFIASYFVDYLIALKEYKNNFEIIFEGASNLKDVVADIKKTSKIPIEIHNNIDGHFDTPIDRDNFKKFISDYSWWFGSKTIDRGDFFISPILNLAQVVNDTQAYIAQITNILSENSLLVNFLKQSTLSEDLSDNVSDEIIKEKLIEENTSIRDFALNVFKHFYGNNWSKLVEQTSTKTSKINSKPFVSHNFDIFSRLLAEFPSPQTKQDLTSSTTQRYFEAPIYESNNKYFYFTTQWNGDGDYDLSFDSLKEYFEKQYPEYKFEKTDTTYKLIKSSLTELTFDYKAFHLKTKEAGLKFTEKIISRFVASLCTKPFVICSGLSGSGKTKLAQSFVQWISKSEEQYKLIPVGADWTNREPLLGFPNGLQKEEYIFPDSGALQLIINASKPGNESKPFFLILDEMNLSHVERYFADFLSIMESQDNIKLYSGEKRSGLLNEISWPKNLFIVGTVNIDETTYMFSPKVLDRANVIEFRISEEEIAEYLSKPSLLEMDKFINPKNKQGYGSNMAKDFLNKAEEKTNVSHDKETLILFFNELKKCGAEFGYRSASEINRLIAILGSLTKDNNKWDEKSISNDDFIDIAIMQKLLPKLHGSRNKLTKILPVLGSLCLKDKTKIKENYFDKIDSIDYMQDENIKYKISFEKICRMFKNAIENGYASYAEA